MKKICLIIFSTLLSCTLFAQQNSLEVLKKNKIKEVHIFLIKEGEPKLNSIAYIDSLGREYKLENYSYLDSNEILTLTGVSETTYDSLDRKILYKWTYQDTLVYTSTYQYLLYTAKKHVVYHTFNSKDEVKVSNEVTLFSPNRTVTYTYTNKNLRKKAFSLS
jgi:hypothetical protein